MEIFRKKANVFLHKGLLNTIGRFVSGPIAMIKHLSELRVHNAFLFLSGISTVLAVFAFNFTSAALYAALCGFFIGENRMNQTKLQNQKKILCFILILASHMSLMPSIIIECVGLDRFTTAFGVLFLFRGAASIVGPPAAGKQSKMMKTTRGNKIELTGYL